jgi:hypothetical protein
MELTHKINDTIISEPIGFDTLKTTIKRHEYHGMSAEVSVSDLEFYGIAAHIIKEAYTNDIDTELNYVVTDQDGDIVYSGAIDLSTYNEHTGDYFSVLCKVGEIGVKTTFNTRSDTSVNLNSTRTIDDKELLHIPTWKNVIIPAKSLTLSNNTEQKNTQVYDDDKIYYEDEDSNLMTKHRWLNLALSDVVTNEYGNMQPFLDLVSIPGINSALAEYADPLYRSPEGDNGQQRYDIEYNISIKIKPNAAIVTTKRDSNVYTENNKYIHAALRITNGYPTNRDITEDYESIDQVTPFGQVFATSAYKYWGLNDASEKTFTLSGRLSNVQSPILTLGVYFYNANGGYNDPTQLTLTIEQGSYVKQYVKTENKTIVTTDVLMIHDALNTIVESISNNELTVRSNWYQRCDSVINGLPFYPIEANARQFGDGALKAITNGYKIRNIEDADGEERNMSLTFKDMIQSLDSIDCIGWGFANENGRIYVRVERWDWFYQPTKILEINDVKEKTRIINDDLLITQLNIGYKKYATSEEYQSIDSIHGERTYESNIKALKKEKTALCDFIADNYAIEETRRARIEKDSNEEFKYDENIFIFALKAEKYPNSTTINYYIPNDVDADKLWAHVDKYDTYNAKISPYRNAYRWINRIYCTRSSKEYKMTKGTINYKATYSTKTDTYTEGRKREYYLKDDANEIAFNQRSEGNSLREVYSSNSGGEIIIPRVVKAEELTIKYPITHEQYKTIMANPYGIIIVDGEECWLKEMNYSFFKEEAELKLIPKAD